MIVLHGQEVVGFGIEEALSDVWIASHAINRDQGTFEVDALRQCRNGGDLVGFFIGCLLAQHQAVGRGERGYQVQGFLPTLVVMAAPRGGKQHKSTQNPG